MHVVGIASSGEELLAHLDEWHPEIVIQDLLLPGGMDGVETTRRLHERAPAVRVIALTASMDEARMAGVLRAGAAGYVRKDADPEILLAAVRAVARGKTFIDPSVQGRFFPGGDDLTRRELDVLRLLAAGRSNKEIANTLEIGDETVKTHVANVLGKLHSENRAQAVAQALKRGLVTLEELE
jgi:NarL family two-component system response regulator LiaR